MKTINLKRVTETLSEKELKNVVGGNPLNFENADDDNPALAGEGPGYVLPEVCISPKCSAERANKYCCFWSTPRSKFIDGECWYIPFGGWVCNEVAYRQTTF
jgi:bacteriocin-like protein